MSTVTVVALIKVKPGSEDAALAVLEPVVRQTYAEEGCLRYALHRSKTDEQQFVIVERWRGQEDLDAHFQKPYMGELMTGVADLLAEPPAIHFLDPTPVGDDAKGAL